MVPAALRHAWAQAYHASRCSALGQHWLSAGQTHASAALSLPTYAHLLSGATKTQRSGSTLLSGSKRAISMIGLSLVLDGSSQSDK
jgi:hypothetical protein